MNLDIAYSHGAFRIGDKYRSVQAGIEVTQMKINMTRIATLIAAVLIICSATAFAQPDGKGMNRMNPGQFPAMNAPQPDGQGMNRMNPGSVQGMNPQMKGMETGMQGRLPFIQPIFMGHGFALDGDEYHVLHVNVVKTAVVRPDYIRSLLGENNTPAEIAQKISTVKRITEVRGHLVFAGTPYALNITAYDNQSLSGDVLALPQTGRTEFAPETPEVVGQISISTSKYEGELLSTGTLTMDGKKYNVLLTSPMAQGVMGRPGKP